MNQRFNLYQLILLLGITALLSACQGTGGAFGPVKPTPTLVGIFDQQSVPVNFETLNSDPSIFIDKYIQVTGRYIPLRQQSCERQRGPSVDWFLISDELEMNMSGFSSVVEIVPEQAFFTVEGIWCRYDGPVGCAKDPTDETVWYLEIVRIIDPNPIIASAFSSNGERIISQPTVVSNDPASETESTPTGGGATATPSIPATATATPSPNANNASPTPSTPTPTIEAIPTRAESTPIPTATLDSGSSSNEPTETPTLSASEQQVTPTVTMTPTTTDGSGGGLGETEKGTPNPSTPVPEPGGNYPYP